MKYFFLFLCLLFTACSSHQPREVVCASFGVQFVLPSSNAAEKGEDYVLTDSNGNQILIPRSQCFQVILGGLSERADTPHEPQGMKIGDE